jgi:sulfide dehydrogenase cytochrome subunit
MKWNVVFFAGTLAAIAGAAHAQTMDPLQLRGLAASCSNCHGTLGVAEPGNESLAGGNKDEMLKKMMDFKTGKKPATIMHQLAKGYTDEQLAALAGYFSSLKK